MLQIGSEVDRLVAIDYDDANAWGLAFSALGESAVHIVHLVSESNYAGTPLAISSLPVSSPVVALGAIGVNGTGLVPIWIEAPPSDPDQVMVKTLRLPAPGRLRGAVVQSLSGDRVTGVANVQQVVQFFEDALETVTDAGDVYVWQFSQGLQGEDLIAPFGHVAPGALPLAVGLNHPTGFWGLDPDGEQVFIADSSCDDLESQGLRPQRGTATQPWTHATGPAYDWMAVGTELLDF